MRENEARSLKIEYVFNKNELNGFTMLSFYCYGSSDIRFVMDEQTGKILYMEAIGQAWSNDIDIHAGKNDNASYMDTLQRYARYLELTPLTDSIDLMRSMGVDIEPYSFLKAELFCTTANNDGQYLRLAVVKDLDYLCIYLFEIYK